MSEVPESIESLIESARREAGALSDYHLDVAIAETLARRDVAAAHGHESTAETYNSLLVALCEVRRVRADMRREVDELTTF